MKIFEIFFKIALLILALSFLFVFYQFSQVGKYRYMTVGSKGYIVLDTTNGKAVEKHFNF